MRALQLSIAFVQAFRGPQRTPVVHYPVACGPHKLALKRRDLKLDRVESVTLAPGHELKQHYDLGDDYGD